MERFTRKDAERSFELLCKVTGHRVAASYDDKGAWSLDHNSVYGGYVVHELLESGGVSEPFGSLRRPARQFCDCVNFVVRAFESSNA